MSLWIMIHFCLNPVETRGNSSVLGRFESLQPVE